MENEKPENKQIDDRSSVSGLSDISVRVCGCANPLQAPFQKAQLDLMHQKVLEFRECLMYSSPQMIRGDAIDILTLLIRSDRAIGLEDSRILCDATNAIHRAMERSK